MKWMEPVVGISASAYLRTFSAYPQRLDLMCICADDNHDSGTESDEESADIEELQKYMEDIIYFDGQKTHLEQCRKDGIKEMTITNNKMEEKQQRLTRDLKKIESPIPDTVLQPVLANDNESNFDHHSSEDELEIINRTSVVYQERNCQYPEKRKWSQANRLSLDENSCSSDDEYRDGTTRISTPVKFRSSPPANVYKPTQSSTPKVFHSNAANIPPHELCSLSPRKKYRRTPTTNNSANIQRPYLDFEKMQQVRVRLL